MRSTVSSALYVSLYKKIEEKTEDNQTVLNIFYEQFFRSFLMKTVSELLFKAQQVDPFLPLYSKNFSSSSCVVSQKTDLTYIYSFFLFLLLLIFLLYFLYKVDGFLHVILLFPFSLTVSFFLFILFIFLLSSIRLWLPLNILLFLFVFLLIFLCCLVSLPSYIRLLPLFLPTFLLYCYFL